MVIRRYSEAWDEKIYKLFWRAVHISNKEFYTEAELDAWAPSSADPSQWCRGLLNATSLLAVEGDELLGFGSAVSDYIDRLYVDPDHQGRGIGKLLLKSLEGGRDNEFHTYASKQARRFFERQGYIVEMEHHAFRRGQTLLNYLMVKPHYE